MPRIRSDGDVLAVSLAATWLLAESGGAASTSELAAAGGVSRSTFHRMFPRKEDCIRPATADAQRIMFEAVEAAPAALSLRDAVVAGLTVAAEGAFAERTRLLLPVVRADAQLWAVWSDECFAGILELARIVDRRCPELGASRSETLAAALLALIILVLRDARDGADAVRRLGSRVDELVDATANARLDRARHKE